MSIRELWDVARAKLRDGGRPCAGSFNGPGTLSGRMQLGRKVFDRIEYFGKPIRVVIYWQGSADSAARRAALKSTAGTDVEWCDIERGRTICADGTFGAIVGLLARTEVSHWHYALSCQVPR